ncbi:MAG: 2-iminoacetate synthase ThiH [Desulfomonilaceae bacterium]|nr:2-iminoacetate synthase ThiH [Desulfomonilaceae bacterium]
MSFLEEIRNLSWDWMKATISEKTTSDVERALQAEKRSHDDLLALLSPAAEPMLEDLAQTTHRLTVQRFGRVIQLYAPIYLSNECVNACVYCGFNRHNRIRRATLTPEEVLEEAAALNQSGFRHVLLLTGESPGSVSPDDLGRIAEALRPLFASISIEVYPMDTPSYSVLIEKGVDGLTIYQESYHRGRYATIHPSGPKRDYDRRLDTPDRGGKAGFRRLNVGALLGLSDWRVEGAFVGMHAAYLLRRYWQSHIAVSFPRLRPAAGGYIPEHPASDRAMVHLMCALRIYLPDAGLVLSTREPAQLRDNLIPLGVTHMSAGSRTSPGGYASPRDAEGQFEINDTRSTREVARKITALGYEPLWKDWDAAFLHA